MNDPLFALNIQTELDWLQQTPSLLKGTPLFSAYTLSATESVSNQCYTPLQPFRYRLGKQFEAIMTTYLTQHPHVVQVVTNLPLREQKRTIGELDLVYEALGHIIHLELAIKFYLLNGQATRLDHFIGPNGNDRLDKKWQRLLTHQLPLGYSHYATTALKARGIPAIQHSYFFMPGILFYPRGLWQTNPILHDAINPDHRRGWWLNDAQLIQLSEQPLYFVMLDKPYWLGGIAHFSLPEREQRVITIQDLIAYRRNHTTPLMVAEVVDVKGQWEEISRGMVVTNDWSEKNA